MSYIDFYLVTPNGQAQDFALAESLVAGDDDAEYYMEEILEALRDNVANDDNMTESIQVNGQTCWVFQYHNGVGDGGSREISNTEWMAEKYPAAFAALGVSIAWSKGPKVLAGQPDGSV